MMVVMGAGYVGIWGFGATIWCAYHKVFIPPRWRDS